MRNAEIPSYNFFRMQPRGGVGQSRSVWAWTASLCTPVIGQTSFFGVTTAKS